MHDPWRVPGVRRAARGREPPAPDIAESRCAVTLDPAHRAQLPILTLQWLAFALTNTIPVPFVVAAALHLSPAATAALAERIFLVTGVMSLAQALVGHRLPIVEGPAGMWWGVFVSLGLLAPAVGMSEAHLREALEFGMVAAGALLALAAVPRRVIRALLSLFTPAVTGGLMILLPAQIAPSIAAALIGSPPSLPRLAVGAATFLAVALGAVFGRGVLRSTSLLLGVAVGTVLWWAIGLPFTPLARGPALALPGVFAWGAPRVLPGVLLPCILTAVLLLSNVLAALRAMAAVQGEPVGPEAVRRAILVNGASIVVSGLLAVPGAIPYASNAGFLSLTRRFERLPFLLFAALLALLGLVPAVGRLVVALPAPVVYAGLLAAMAQLLAIGVADLAKEGLGLTRSLLVTAPILLGIGIMGVPEATWRGLHSPMSFLVGDGMIVGLLLLLLLRPLARLGPPDDGPAQERGTA